MIEYVDTYRETAKHIPQCFETISLVHINFSKQAAFLCYWGLQLSLDQQNTNLSAFSQRLSKSDSIVLPEVPIIH